MWGKILLTGVLSAGVATSAIGQVRGCDEEQHQAAAWIQWAAERRATCLLNTSSQETRSSCLQSLRVELAHMEQEHARVYSDQIRTLHPGHPVVKNLMAKLKDNVDAAETAIMTDTEPEQIAALRKQLCLNRR